MTSADRGKTQRVILRSLQKLVADSPHAGTLLRETPAILRALHDIDLLAADAVLEWHAQSGEKRQANARARLLRSARRQRHLSSGS
eukprot:2163718-Prymnesium_polylepis.1